MPRSRKPSKKEKRIDLNYIIITYGIGMYGGLVSAVLFSWLTKPPSPNDIWFAGGALIVIGVVLFVIISQLLGKNRK